MHNGCDEHQKYVCTKIVLCNDPINYILGVEIFLSKVARYRHVFLCITN